MSKTNGSSGAKLPLLITVDGEAKTAKTTATDAICAVLRRNNWNIYEADAGAFFRRMAVCSLEELGHHDLDAEDPKITDDDLHGAMNKIIASDTAFADRAWPSLASKLVERYVSVIGNTIDAQNAMDTWYDKITEIAVAKKYDMLVINARNPRARLREWQSPVLDLLVYCESREAARRILFARGITEPSDDQWAKQTADVKRRRELDRNRDKYPFVDPGNVLVYDTNGDSTADSYVATSFDNRFVWNASQDLPSTIKLDTTHISLAQTKKTIAKLAQAAVTYKKN